MIFLKFKQEIKGASNTKGYEGWINVEACQFGVGRGIAATGSSADRETSTPSFSEITFTKATDIASTGLFAQSIYGKSLGLATIAYCNTHSNEIQCYMQIELTDPIVSGYSSSSGGDRPSESFSLNFTKAVMGYREFSGDKKTSEDTKGWDLSSGEQFDELTWSKSLG